jgi:hypothetical protein
MLILHRLIGIWTPHTIPELHLRELPLLRTRSPSYLRIQFAPLAIIITRVLATDLAPSHPLLWKARNLRLPLPLPGPSPLHFLRKMAEKKIGTRAEPERRMSPNQHPNQKKGGAQRELRSRLLVISESRVQGTKKNDDVTKRNVDVRRISAEKRSNAATRVTTSRRSKRTRSRKPPDIRRGGQRSKTIRYLLCF